MDPAGFDPATKRIKNYSHMDINFMLDFLPYAFNLVWEQFYYWICMGLDHLINYVVIEEGI